MIPSTLSQAVSPGDLIFVYTADGGWMLLTKIGSNEPNPPTSAITVHQIFDSIYEENGYWTLSGRDVYYVEEDENSSQTEDGNETKQYPLDSFLDMIHAGNANDSEGGSQEISIIVNPHGRDVLEYYFGVCPFCDGDGWICPGCSGSAFPDLFGSCGLYQACPVCLGYEFAMEDKGYVSILEDYENPLYERKHHPERSTMTDETANEMKQEALALVRERYEVITAMMREMGLQGLDIEGEVESWKDVYC